MPLDDVEFRNIKSANEKAKNVAAQGLNCSVTILWNKNGMEKILVNSEFFTSSATDLVKKIDATMDKR